MFVLGNSILLHKDVNDHNSKLILEQKTGKFKYEVFCMHRQFIERHYFWSLGQIFYLFFYESLGQITLAIGLCIKSMHATIWQKANWPRDESNVLLSI